MSTVADLTAAGVAWGILQRTPPEINGESGQGWEASITFRIPFGAPTTTFLGVVSGLPVTVTVGGASVTRLIPLQHPDYPALLACRVACRAFGGQASNGSFWGTSWGYNEATVGFRSVPYAVDGSTPFYTLERQWDADYVTMPGNSFRFPSDGTPVKQDAGFLVPTTNYTLTIYQAPSVNDAAVDALVCNVNSTTFLGWPTGTVLFKGGNTRTTLGMAGVQESTLVYNFLYRSIPHNYLLRPNGVWEAVANLASGNPMFPSSDLNALIQ